MKKMVSMMLACILGSVLTTMSAGEKVSVNGKVDLVSNYVWRGCDQGSGVSVQPSLGIVWNGLSLTAWGSQSVGANHSSLELDITVAYSVEGLTLSVADLWWGGINGPYGYYDEGPKDNPVDGAHHFEASVAYDFEKKFSLPLSVSWYTWFAGADVDNSKGKRAYSSYANIAYRIACPCDIQLTPAIGITPWAGYYHDKCGITDVTLTASKSLKLNERFSMPVFIQAIASPIYDHAYLVAGFGLAF